MVLNLNLNYLNRREPKRKLKLKSGYKYIGTAVESLDFVRGTKIIKFALRKISFRVINQGPVQ